jgi:hypothetical protein
MKPVDEPRSELEEIMVHLDDELDSLPDPERRRRSEIAGVAVVVVFLSALLMLYASPYGPLGAGPIPRDTAQDSPAAREHVAEETEPVTDEQAIQEQLGLR